MVTWTSTIPGQPANYILFRLNCPSLQLSSCPRGLRPKEGDTVMVLAASCNQCRRQLPTTSKTVTPTSQAAEENPIHLVSDTCITLLRSSHATTGPCIPNHSPYSSHSLGIVISFPLPHQLASSSYSHSFNLLYEQISLIAWCSQFPKLIRSQIVDFVYKFMFIST